MAVLAAHGYDGSTHRARQFDPAWFPELDLVIALDARHARTLHGWAPDDTQRAKVALLRSFDTGPGGPGIDDRRRPADLDVPDPYYDRPQDGRTASVGTTSLVPGATLTGRVTTDAGVPVPNAIVKLGVFCGCVSADEVQTDADGRYTIRGIAPQRSIVEVVTPWDQPYAWQWSGDAADPTRAQALTFRDQQTTTFDVKLHPQAGLTITRTGGPNYAVTVHVTSASGAPVAHGRDMGVGETAVISGVPASAVRISYTVGRNTYWYNGATTLARATPIRVSATRNASVTIVVPPS